MASNDAGLTQKQKDFCREYLVDFNGTQAAIRAGYSAKTANEQASRALTNVNIQAEIARLTEDKSRRTAITADSLVLEAREVMARCMQGEPVKDRDGNPIGEWKFDAANALKAQELQAKLLGLFRDTGSKGNPLHMLVSSIPDFDED